MFEEKKETLEHTTNSKILSRFACIFKEKDEEKTVSERERCFPNEGHCC